MISGLAIAAGVLVLLATVGLAVYPPTAPYVRRIGWPLLAAALALIAGGALARGKGRKRTAPEPALRRAQTYALEQAAESHVDLMQRRGAAMQDVAEYKAKIAAAKRLPEGSAVRRKAVEALVWGD